MRPAKLLIPAQIGAATVALLALALWPPAAGALLLVPIAGGDANTVAKVALAGGAVLLGPGPFPGSLVVIGDRAKIAQSGSWTLMIVSAPPGGCVTGPKTGTSAA